MIYFYPNAAFHLGRHCLLVPRMQRVKHCCFLDGNCSSFMLINNMLKVIGLYVLENCINLAHMSTSKHAQTELLGSVNVHCSVLNNLL